MDIATQIEEGDLFDFDTEVEPILEVLVGKSLERAAMEVMEDEELASMRRHQEHFQQLREQELVEVQRMEASEQRRQEEKERRKEQTRARQQFDEAVMRKVGGVHDGYFMFEDRRGSVLVHDCSAFSVCSDWWCVILPLEEAGITCVLFSLLHFLFRSADTLPKRVSFVFVWSLVAVFRRALRRRNVLRRRSHRDGGFVYALAPRQRRGGFPATQEEREGGSSGSDGA